MRRRAASGVSRSKCEFVPENNLGCSIWHQNEELRRGLKRRGRMAGANQAAEDIVQMREAGLIGWITRVGGTIGVADDGR